MPRCRVLGRRHVEMHGPGARRGVGREVHLHLLAGAEAAFARQLDRQPGGGGRYPAPPTPAVPAWMHEPPIMSTLVGVEAKVVDGVTVTESLLGPDNADGSSKVTAKFVMRAFSHRAGRGGYRATAPDGAPMVIGVGRHIRVSRNAVAINPPPRVAAVRATALASRSGAASA